MNKCKYSVCESPPVFEGALHKALFGSRFLRVLPNTRSMYVTMVFETGKKSYVDSCELS